MEYRHGTCTSCEAHYRVPATFKADKAKCKKCDGVVEIGPVEGGGDGAPAAVPAKKPPVTKPAAPKAAAPRAARPKVAAKPAPKAGTPRSGSKDSVRSAAEAAAERVRGAGAKKPGGKRAGTAGQSGKAGSRSSSRRTKREPKPKKKNMGVVVGALVVVVVIVFGAVFFLNQGDSATQAAETELAAAPETPIEAPVEEPVEEEAPVEEPDPEPEPEAEAEEPVAKVPEVKDPSSVDLSLLEDQVKLPETSDEDWSNIEDLVATFIDPNAGAAGNRARKQLLEKGRVAFPAILNAFKRIDVTSQEGYRDGDLIQKLLMDICRGNNFDWRYTTEPNDAYFNKRVIEMWFKSWAQVVENPKAWIQMGKLTPEEGVEYMAAFEDPADIGVSDDLDDF